MTPVANHRIKDSRLSEIMTSFVNNWRDTKYNLFEGGYIQSSISTYSAARKLSRDPNQEAVKAYVKSSPTVFPNHVDTLTDLLCDKRLSFVALNYPVLASFETFFFKGRHPEVQEILCDTIDDFGDRADNPADIQQLMDELRFARITATGSLQDDIEIELEVLYSVQRFIAACKRQTEAVQQIFQEYMTRMNRDLHSKRFTLTHDEYSNYKAYRIDEIHSLQTRFTRGIVAMLNFSEN